MAPITSTVNLDFGGAMEALSFFGIPDLNEWLKELDGDPEKIQESYAGFREAAEAAGTGTQAIGEGEPGKSWTDKAGEALSTLIDGFVTGVATLLEFVIFLPEAALQIVDWLLDAIRWACVLIMCIIAIVVAIFVLMVAIVSALAASVFGSPGIPGVITAAIEGAWAAMEIGWVAFIGGVAVLLGILAFVLKIVDVVIEKIIEGSQWLREKLGDRIGEVPDWDPKNPWIFLPR